ncbi:MAG: glycosyltransferase family 9 protein [Verrucomicrobiota bacterium]
MEARENILIIRLKSIGDILFTLPAVHVVRENFPNAKLHFLVSKEYAPLLLGFSDIDEIIPLDREVFHSGNLKTIGTSLFQLLRHLRELNFCLVIDFHGYGETEIFSWWSGAPERWGSVYHHTRGWTYTCGIWRNDKIHPAEANLSLLQQCGLRTGKIRNEYVLPADALDEARKFFAVQNLDAAKPTLFIQPFTSAAHKNWPLEKFLELARHFHSRGIQIIFGGGPNERIALEPACATGFCVAAGTPLLVTAGLMKFSTLVVGADTGLLHLAVAMGKRVVVIMKSNGPGNPHPFRHADWTVTQPAGKAVSEIQTEVVIEACVRASDGFHR